MGLDLNVYIEHQAADGTWHPICTKIEEPDHKCDLDKDSSESNNDEPKEKTCSDYLANSWGRFWRWFPFFAVLVPKYEHPCGVNTEWTREYPVIDTKPEMPVDMCKYFDSTLRQYHGCDRPWINWSSGTQLQQWFDDVRALDTAPLNDDDLYNASSDEETGPAIFGFPGSSSLLFVPPKRKDENKLSETDRFVILERYLRRAILVTGLTPEEKDLARLRVYFLLE